MDIIQKKDILEIIAECQKYHIEFVPSLDSPGHMRYVLNYLPDDWDCTSLWPESSDFRSPQVFNIYEKEECKQFLKDLFTEYADFFSKAGCKHMNIGGDEFLNNFGSMTNDQYVTVMNYFNEISALVKSYGLTPRAWNDGLMYSGYTGYTLDPDIEICYWSGPAQVATIEEFVKNGNKVINMSDAYMYYVLGSWWMSAANPAGDKIYSEWNPGKFPSARNGEQVFEYPYPEYVLGASFAVWCDTPSLRTQDQIATEIYMRTRATAEKCWNPTTTVSYSNLQSYCNTLGRAPGYDGNELPAPGEIYSEGTLGTVVLRYVDKEGNSLRNDRTVYGLIDAEYTITPDKLYGYRFVSMDKDAEGIYTAEEVVITLTYELYTDKAELQAAVDSAAKESDCIPETYDNFGKALKEAKAVLADEKATQEAVDAALDALEKAEKELISLDRVDLYLEVNYPIGSAGYTTSSYNDYKSALTAGKAVLLNADATSEEVETALNNILAKKEALSLLPADDMITITSTDPGYTFDGGYPLSNMMDNNLSTFAWLNDAQHVGDVVTFTFAKPVTLNSFRYQAPANAGKDIFYNAVVEISQDGQTWTEIGTLQEVTDKTINAGGKTVQYVQIRMVEAYNYWTKIAEITLDYTEISDSVDKSALANAIETAEALTETDYTEASWTVLEAALANAEEINAKETVTAGEVNAAVSALEGAVNALQEKPVVPDQPAGPEVPSVQGVTRIFGTGRIDTGLAVAETYKDKLGIDKFETVIIATGKNFADALPGSYLAYVESAPILLTSDARMKDVVAYVKANLAYGGKVYILGGTAAVSGNLDGELEAAGYTVDRLAGKDRYETNLMILKAAKVTGGEIIAATGRNFADSLSASAVKKPILLVKDHLTAEQKVYLAALNVEKIYIVGGTGAVKETVEAELGEYGLTDRISGANRRETSVKVAQKFFDKPETAVVASAKNFPDGLCGGPLAAVINAPLILTADGKTTEAAGYVQEEGIDAGYVLGGEAALKNDSVVNVFKLGSAEEIIVK